MTRACYCLVFIWLALCHLNFTVLTFEIKGISSTAKGVNHPNSPDPVLTEGSVLSDEFLDYINQIINDDDGTLGRQRDSTGGAMDHQSGSSKEHLAENAIHHDPTPQELQRTDEPIPFQQHPQDLHAAGSNLFHESTSLDSRHLTINNDGDPLERQRDSTGCVIDHPSSSSAKHLIENGIYYDPTRRKRQRIDEPIPFEQHLEDLQATDPILFHELKSPGSHHPTSNLIDDAFGPRWDSTGGVMKHPRISSEEHLGENAVIRNPTPKQRSRKDDHLLQLHRQEKHADYDLGEGHQQSAEASTSKPHRQGFQQHSDSQKAELLADSVYRAECLKLALKLFKQSHHESKKAHYRYIFLNRVQKCSSESKTGQMKGSTKIQQMGFPIVLSKKRGNNNDYNVRLFRSSNKPKYAYTLVYNQIPFARLLAAIDFFHGIFYQNGLDQCILGIKEEVHSKLIEWFGDMVFEGTEGSPPLLGLATIASKPEIVEPLFGPPQKYTSFCLTHPRQGDDSLVENAISLVGYWYKNVAPRHAETPEIGDDLLWLAFYTIFKLKDDGLILF